MFNIFRHIQRDIGFQNATLYGGMLESGNSFWFPVYHAATTNDENYQFFMDVVEKAKTEWLKKRSIDPYSGHLSKSFTKEPKPTPTKTPEEMLVESFPMSFYIEDETHPLLQTKQKRSNNDVEEEDS